MGIITRVATTIIIGCVSPAFGCSGVQFNSFARVSLASTASVTAKMTSAAMPSTMISPNVS